MTFDIEMLFPETRLDGEKSVAGLTHQDIVTVLTSAPGRRSIVLLHMLYPRTDARTHHSLDSLVHSLHGHGLHQLASLVANETHYLLFTDPAQAWTAFHEIRRDSLAIGVHLYFRGLTGDAAEHALDAYAHQAS
ncbi:hypothetical protein ACT2FY_38085 [Paraburkholderia fungorum]|uniref:hypothetical protein n=1 Tax=Paraburkholderia fungorum TaxID=134537 RepID=UPI00402BDF3B